MPPLIFHGNGCPLIFRCTVVGTVTAIGGGTWRDLLLGKRVFWMDEALTWIRLRVEFRVPVRVRVGFRVGVG